MGNAASGGANRPRRLGAATGALVTPADGTSTPTTVPAGATIVVTPATPATPMTPVTPVTVAAWAMYTWADHPGLASRTLFVALDLIVRQIVEQGGDKGLRACADTVGGARALGGLVVWIASKFEDVEALTCTDASHACRRSVADMVRAEWTILKHHIDFRIGGKTRYDTVVLARWADAVPDRVVFVAACASQAAAPVAHDEHAIAAVARRGAATRSHATLVATVDAHVACLSDVCAVADADRDGGSYMVSWAHWAEHIEWWRSTRR